MTPTPGRKRSTRSSPPPDPNPARIGNMLHDLVEMAPSVMYPLEVICGAREPLAPPVPDRPKSAVFDVIDRSTGILYEVIVVPHSAPESSSSKL